MSIGWPKANGRFVVQLGLRRASSSVVGAATAYRRWPTFGPRESRRPDLDRAPYCEPQAENSGTGLWERIEPVSCQEEKGT